LNSKQRNYEKFTSLRGQIIELIEAIGCKENQRHPEIIKLSVSVVSHAALFLGTSQNGLAALLGVNDTKTVRAWFSGKDTPRKAALLLLEKIVGNIVLPPDTIAPEIGVPYCVDAVCGLLDELESKALLAGWDGLEIRDAVKMWCAENKV